MFTKKSIFNVLVLFVVFALTFSAVGVKPAQAAGVYTHSLFVEEAINRLAGRAGYSDLVRILNDYPEVVNYGALFPDVTYSVDSDWAEMAHDTGMVKDNYRNFLQFLQDHSYSYDSTDKPDLYKEFLEDPDYTVMTPEFRRALIVQISSHFNNIPRSAEDEALIAFLFGVIAHQEADIPWHWPPGSCDGSWLGVECAMGGHEFELDLHAKTMPDFEKVTDAYFDYIDVDGVEDTIMSASDAKGYRRPFCVNPCVAAPGDPIRTGNFNQHAIWDLPGVDYGDGADYILHEYSPSGIHDGGALIAGAWMHTWDVLINHYTPVLYVKPEASGLGNCYRWESACTLDTALRKSFPGQEIWVAAGTYTPSSTDRAATFQLPQGAAVYGGFNGTEAFFEQRNPANVTILSGDIEQNDINKDGNNIAETSADIQGGNSYHVVMGANNATLDGFTITGGHAYNISPNVGGGMVNRNINGMTVSNVTFSGNAADGSGGGMFNISSDVTITNVTFRGNSTNYDGGGIYHGYGKLTATNVTFSGNSANKGGGIYNGEGNVRMTNVTFSGNVASQGSGLFTYNSRPSITNAIFWGNTAAQIYNAPESPLDKYPEILYSVIEGGCPTTMAYCKNIITTDPKLGTLGNYGGFTPTIPLLRGSSAIDTAIDWYWFVYYCPATDQRGVARPHGVACDIGAYESAYTGVYYVKPSASGSGNCQSWQNACALQTALSAALSEDEIWVAAGIYTPVTPAGATPTDEERLVAFQLRNGVAVYGGFAGTETNRNQRGPNNVTTLSGDIGTPGNSDNSYHVVTADGITGATLEGFTISGGNANGAAPQNKGGGMYNYDSSPTVTNVIFSGNTASMDGGGMYNDNASSPTVTNVTFSGNSAIYGGGMYNSGNSSPTVTNVTFSDNTADDSGGGMFNNGSHPTVTNVTFSDNKATRGNGGGMSNNWSSNVTVRNAIFWDKDNTLAVPIYNDSSTTVVSDSVVQNGYADGTNIITDDPLLGTLGNNGGYTTTIAIAPQSAAVNAGNIAYCAIGKDQRGVRYYGPCDIGAYEYDYAGIATLYVKPSASDTESCQSWDDACSLQTALDVASSGWEIWVAAGVHKPTAGTDRTATFQLKSGVNVYGGFPNTGNPGMSDRHPAANVTILSGDIGTSGNNSDNSYHVVTADEINGATLDGFTISGGHANGAAAAAQNKGGGMYNYGSSSTVTNVIFSGNSASLDGGGMYNDNASNPTVTNVTFSGNSAIYGGGMYNIFGSNPTLTNVTFSDNTADDSGGGMFNNRSSPMITNVTFSDNKATRGSGGGMSNNYGSSPTVTNVIFSGNWAIYGGGMYNNGNSSPTVTNVTFSDNTADDSGGGMFNDGSSPTVTNVTFSANKATRGKGGGMYNYGSSPTVTNVIFSGNTASLDGGGMYIDNSSSPTVTNVTFSGNSALYGGGMYNNGNSSPTVTNVTFSDNTADDSGGGMFNNSSSPTVTNVTFSTNKATRGKGGGMHNYGSSPTVTNVIFSGNTASLDGGGMYIDNASSPTVTNVTFSGNWAIYGGGMYNNGNSSPTVTNVTFSDNTADDSGGGMFNNGSHPTVTNVTFSDNKATRGNGGGMSNNWSSNVTVRNAIFWDKDNTLAVPIYNDSSTTVVSDSVVQNGYADGTNIITDDPLLGTLGNNGGFTPTIPILPGSSAIDAGNATYCTIGTDQRGVSYVGACDIGAFEYVKMAPVATTNAASAITTTGATLNGTVNANNDSSTVTFEYGLSTSYGTTVTATQSPVTGITNTAVSKAIIGLTLNTTYHYRVVAVNSGGTTNGLDQTFKTLAMVQRAKNGGFNLYPIGKKIPTSWVAAQFATTDGKDTATKKEGAASVKIAGAAGKIKTLTQTLSLIGPLGDTFTFSYWVKASKFPAAGLCQAQVSFYSGATLKGTKTLKCPTGATYNWKQAKLNFTAPAAYTKVVIKFTFSKVSGTVWFDLVSLLR